MADICVAPALACATIFIEIRSIFRVAELSGGFKGRLWNSEVDFMVLDGAMVAAAALLMTLFHPGPALGLSPVWGWGGKAREHD